MGLSTADISVIATGSVAVVGLLVSYRQSERGRDHERKLAVAAHEHERRMAAEAAWQSRAQQTYLDLFKYLLLVDSIMTRTKPLIGPQADPPAMPPENELTRIEADVMLFGSPQVWDMLQRWAADRAVFFAHCDLIDVYKTHGDTELEVRSWDKVHACRAAARDLIAAMRTQANAELRGDARPASDSGAQPEGRSPLAGSTI